jgi:DNA-binding IclR family transcriptional regulator
MLAFLPEEEKRELVNTLSFKRFNERTITSKKSYLKLLETVREKGYAVDHAEENEGMHCIGAPIFNRHGYPVAAIWITGPSSRIEAERFDEIGRVIKQHADQISRSLGYGIAVNNHHLP